MGAAVESYGKGLLRSHTLGLLEFDDNGNVRGGWEGEGKNFGNQFGRTAIGALTFGTSDAKTGGGEYGDETVADSLFFPKSITDVALGRGDSRKATDAKTKAEAAAANPGPAPDATDELLAQNRGNTKLRLQSKQGRRSTFLSGAMGGSGY